MLGSLFLFIETVLSVSGGACVSILLEYRTLCLSLTYNNENGDNVNII